jgi:hypothetical protein
MNALLTAIVTWLSINFGLPAIYDHPHVTLMPPAQITKLRYGIDRLPDGRAVVAAYDDRAGAILLPTEWTGRTPAELSILVHEMVHHLQNKAGLTYPCPGAREAIAYAAQAKWLGQFGADLAQEFDVDPITLKVITACMIP